MILTVVVISWIWSPSIRENGEKLELRLQLKEYGAKLQEFGNLTAWYYWACFSCDEVVNKGNQLVYDCESFDAFKITRLITFWL